MIKHEKHGDAYTCTEEFTYYSPRYQKEITVPLNQPSNGANFVKDLVPDAFFVHDRGCETGLWDDGSKMCNLELSFVYYDILRFYGVPWTICADRFVGTLLGGGGKARENGLLRVKKNG